MNTSNLSRKETFLLVNARRGESTVQPEVGRSFQHCTLAGRDNLPNQKGWLNTQAMATPRSRCACKESLKLGYSANQVVPWPWCTMTIISILMKHFTGLAQSPCARYLPLVSDISRNAPSERNKKLISKRLMNTQFITVKMFDEWIVDDHRHEIS